MATRARKGEKLEKKIKEEYFGFLFVFLKKYRKENNADENKCVSCMEGINKIRDQEGLDLRKDLELE